MIVFDPNTGQYVEVADDGQTGGNTPGASSPPSAVNTGGNTGVAGPATQAIVGGDAFDPSRVPAGVPADWAADFIARNPGDYARLASAYASGGPGRTGGPTAPPASGGNWFTLNGLAPPSGYGDVPAPFSENYTPLARPAWLTGEYQTPAWTGGDFKAPTMAEVQGEAGYQTGLNSGIQARDRSAAAKGSVLSGGQQVALTRYGTDYGATKYGESYGRAFDAYKTRYGQFQDSAASSLASRGVNETSFQNDQANNLTGYNTRYTSYLNDILNRRNAETDWWNRQQDTIHNSLTAAGLARPPA